MRGKRKQSKMFRSEDLSLHFSSTQRIRGWQSWNFSVCTSSFVDQNWPNCRSKLRERFPPPWVNYTNILCFVWKLLKTIWPTIKVITITKLFNTHLHTTNAICWFPAEKLATLTCLLKKIFCYINCTSLRWARRRHLQTAVDMCLCVLTGLLSLCSDTTGSLISYYNNRLTILSVIHTFSQTGNKVENKLLSS